MKFIKTLNKTEHLSFHRFNSSVMAANKNEWVKFSSDTEHVTLLATLSKSRGGGKIIKR